MLLVVGSAVVITRILRSPEEVVWRTPVWKTTKGMLIGSSLLSIHPRKKENRFESQVLKISFN
jgi:hypothetical protein